ncbi:IS1 family transposase [Shigella flexneri]
MVTVNLHCPRYQSVQVYRHGQNPKTRSIAALLSPGISAQLTVTSPVNRELKTKSSVTFKMCRASRDLPVR